MRPVPGDVTTNVVDERRRTTCGRASPADFRGPQRSSRGPASCCSPRVWPARCRLSAELAAEPPPRTAACRTASAVGSGPHPGTARAGEQALAAAEKSLAIERRLSGDLSHGVAVLLTWIASGMKPSRLSTKPETPCGSPPHLYPAARASHWRTKEASSTDLAQVQACQRLTPPQRQRWPPPSVGPAGAQSRLTQGQYQQARSCSRTRWPPA